MIVLYSIIRISINFQQVLFDSSCDYSPEKNVWEGAWSNYFDASYMETPGNASLKKKWHSLTTP